MLYHLSDPLIGLRRLYNAMRPGGLLCLESMSFESDESVLRYEGPSVRRGESGWNWLVPSPRAIAALPEDAGFEVVALGDGLRERGVTRQGDPLGPGRCFAVARRRDGHAICQAGLSTAIR